MSGLSNGSSAFPLAKRPVSKTARTITRRRECGACGFKTSSRGTSAPLVAEAGFMTSCFSVPRSGRSRSVQSRECDFPRNTTHNIVRPRDENASFPSRPTARIYSPAAIPLVIATGGYVSRKLHGRQHKTFEPQIKQRPILEWTFSKVQKWLYFVRSESDDQGGAAAISRMSSADKALLKMAISSNFPSQYPSLSRLTPVPASFSFAPIPSIFSRAG